uniref:AB hydrolase-1 domain-containing protein n=1 Tax=Cavia porcellus TaxID=10141 RepID=H0VSA2_CAVPO
LHYVAPDFLGHGLSTRYSPGFPFHHQNFVSEAHRVTAALKWDHFSLMGHSFG